MATVGLLLDIIGVYLLAHTLFLRTVNKTVDVGYPLARTSFQTYYGAEIIHRSLKENLLTRIGLAIVILGFSLQLISNWVVEKNLHPAQVILLAIGIYVVIKLSIDKHSRDTFSTSVELLDRIRQRKPYDPIGTDPWELRYMVDIVRFGKNQPSFDQHYFYEVHCAQMERHQ